MALTAGRQSWTNNGAYGSFIKSVLHYKDDAWDNYGPTQWYRSENHEYGAFGPPNPTSSFKDIAHYRNNVRQTWEFKVSPTTYNELGQFYVPPTRPEGGHKDVLSSATQSTDVATQNDSADIHFFKDGKVNRSSQISEEDLLKEVSRNDGPRDRKHLKAPASLPPVKKHAGRSENRMANKVPLPEIAKGPKFEYERAHTPLRSILKRLDDREHQESSWHRYIEEKERLLEELKNKDVKGVTKIPRDDRPFVPSVHTNDTVAKSYDPAFLKSHFYTTKGNSQPGTERVFVSDDYGGESKLKPREINTNSGASKYLPILPDTPQQQAPTYIETPWPMNMTVPIQTTSTNQQPIRPPAREPMPKRDKSRLDSYRFEPEYREKPGLRTICDYSGSTTMYIA